MTAAPLAVNSSMALWYLARGSGVVALLLLTLTLVSGTVTSVRWSSEKLPRFVTQLLHRNVSLLAVVFLAIHIATVVIDGFAPIGWLDAIVPFRSGYRPLWLGFGALAFDLVLALIITSLLRHRIGQRTWRIIHWSAYACWPLAVLHGLGAGTDTKSGLMLVTTIGCIALVVAGVLWRLATASSERAGARLAGVAAALIAPLVLGAWLVDGPLASGWAERAGTPTALLGGGSASSNAATPASAASGSLPEPPFTADVTGTITRTPSRDGRLTLDLSLQMSGGADGYLDVTLSGQPTGRGGVYMDASRVRMGPNPSSLVYEGEVTSLDGSTIFATLRGASDRSVDLAAGLRVQGESHISGQIRVGPGRASSSQRSREERGESGEGGSE